MLCERVVKFKEIMIRNMNSKHVYCSSPHSINGPCGGRNLGGIVCVAKLCRVPKPLFDPVQVVTGSKWAMNLIMDDESH